MEFLLKIAIFLKPLIIFADWQSSEYGSDSNEQDNFKNLKILKASFFVGIQSSMSVT